jgi:hypothetical protein
VIDVTSLDVRAVVEQVLRRRHGAREVERGLAIAAPRVDEARVRRDELTEAPDQAQPRRRVDVDRRAALDRVGREVRLGRVEKPKAARPPSRLRVQVGSGLDQDIEHVPARDARMEQRVAAIDRLVDRGLQLGVSTQQLAHATRFTRAHRLARRFEGLAHVLVNTPGSC